MISESSFTVTDGVVNDKRSLPRSQVNRDRHNRRGGQSSGAKISPNKEGDAVYGLSSLNQKTS